MPSRARATAAARRRQGVGTARTPWSAPSTARKEGLKGVGTASGSPAAPRVAETSTEAVGEQQPDADEHGVLVATE